MARHPLAKPSKLHSVERATGPPKWNKENQVFPICNLAELSTYPASSFRGASFGWGPTGIAFLVLASLEAFRPAPGLEI
jgi:hypothetical protein